MDTLPIGLALAVSEQAALRLLSVCPSPLVDELDLEGVAEALHRAAVVVVAGRKAQGWLRPRAGALPPTGLGRVRADAIRVTDGPGRPCAIRSARGDGTPWAADRRSP